LNFRTSYVRDLAGQEISRQSALNHYISFVYDAAGRQIAIVNEASLRWTTSYDADSRVVSTTNGEGRTVQMGYDAVGNLVTKVYSNGPRFTFAFDSLNRLTTSTDGAGVTTYAYDPRSMLVEKTYPGNLHQAYGYDGNGNRILLVDPDQGRYTTTFDPLDRTLVAKKPNALAFTSAYDADSRRVSLAMGNGTIRNYGYDAVSQLTTQIDVTSAGVQISTMIDSYDPAGFRVGRNKDGFVTTWINDARNRLVGQHADGAWATFSYDAVGNTLTKQHQGQFVQTMTYNAANLQSNVALGNVKTTYTFDKAGNQTIKHLGVGLTTYAYGIENRLVGVTNPDGTLSTYTYQGTDGLRRTVQEPGQALTTTVRDGRDALQERN